MILINMEMPKKCADCPFFESKYHYHGCLAKPESINNINMWNFVGDRPSWCPLIEVPKHGRLIDADAISEDDRQVYGFYNNYDLQQLLDNCPTIIEAEGEDE